MRLALDFAHPRPRVSALGWLLLIAGLAGAGWAGWRYQSVAATHQTEQLRLATLAPKVAAKSAAKAKAKPETGLSGLAATRLLLGADWGALLNQLEASRPKEIALLNVEAEAARGSLSLSAEAKDHRAMLAYADALEALPNLDRVAIANHADQDRDGEKSVRFTLRAHWDTSGGRP